MTPPWVRIFISIFDIPHSHYIILKNENDLLKMIKNKELLIKHKSIKITIIIIQLYIWISNER